VSADAGALAREIEHHLRALLRDVICGHLRPELVELADSLLWEQGEPEPSGELRVVRRVPAPASPELRVLRRPPAPPAPERPVSEDYCATEGDAPLRG
jgi:hypothetical protein